MTENTDDLTGWHHCKEDRSRTRCSECGRVLRSHESQKRGICSICEPHNNIEMVWSRRMKVRDDLLVAYMNEKLHPTEPPSPLVRLKQAANQRVEVKDAPDLLAFLKKKVIIK